MPKIIELTVQVEIQKVSCPGVWLCQDGRVSLTVFMLGTSYQTCMLPPLFPLTFKDIFYFRKRFSESCALNNICCILKDETIYCELVQWSDDCHTAECTVLAQYLGALNDVLFPSNTCMSDGVDLLMRRSKDFPGILSPKIEISTKVRIDEVWDPSCVVPPTLKATSCGCARPSADPTRAKPVCHSAQYHRNKCNKRASPPLSRARSRSRSQGSSRSCGSLAAPPAAPCRCHRSPPCPPASRPPDSHPPHTPRAPRNPRRSNYNVYNLHTMVGGTLPDQEHDGVLSDSEDSRYCKLHDKYKTGPISILSDEERIQKLLLESHHIDQHDSVYRDRTKERDRCRHEARITPCVCEICRKYHELFHSKELRG